jgi:hypothetical protein
MMLQQVVTLQLASVDYMMLQQVVTLQYAMHMLLQQNIGFWQVAVQQLHC